MNRRYLSIALLGALLLLGSPLIAQADTLWNFFGPQAPFPTAPSGFVSIGSPGGTTAVTNADGFTVGLTPIGDFTNASIMGTLTGENGGAGSNEQGAGVCVAAACPPTGTDRHFQHIEGNEALRLTLPTGLDNFSIRIASLDPGTESANVWAGSVGGTLIGTVVRGANPDFSALSIPNADDALPIFVTGVGSTDTIVYGLTATPVPEPSTLLLLGSSLAGLGGFTWRRKRK